MGQVILIDTNTWVDYILGKPTRVDVYLRAQRVRTCDVVIGELSRGSGLPQAFRTALLKLPKIPCPSTLDTLKFMDRHRQTLAGAGVGWADTQVILAAERAGSLLYTNDIAMRDLWLYLGYRLVDSGPRDAT